MELVMTTVYGPINEFARQYGQLAFGVCTFLIIWFTVFKPNEDREVQRTEALLAVTAQLQQTAIALENTSANQKLILKLMQGLDNRSEEKPE